MRLPLAAACGDGEHDRRAESEFFAADFARYWPGSRRGESCIEGATDYFRPGSRDRARRQGAGAWDFYDYRARTALGRFAALGAHELLRFARNLPLLYTPRKRSCSRI